MVDQYDTSINQTELKKAPHVWSMPPEPLPTGMLEVITFFLDCSPDALVLVNTASAIVLTNTPLERLFGYSREELAGQPLGVLIPEPFHAAHAGQKAPSQRDSCPRAAGVERLLTGRHKDGRVFPVDMRCQPLRIGEAVYRVKTIRALDPLREILHEGAHLAEPVHLQSELINLAHDAMLIYDPEGHILSWNEGAEHLYGWTAQEAVGKISHTLLQTRFPLSQDALHHTLERHSQWQGELIHTCRNGTQVIVESRQVLMRDEQGKPSALLEINRDVTERRRLEQLEQAHAEMKARLDVLQLILDRLPAGVFLVRGAQLRLILANRAAHDLWGAEWPQGQSMDDFLTQSGVCLCAEDGHPLLPVNTATSRAVVFGEAVSQSQVVVRQPDGTNHSVLLSTVPFDDLRALSRLPFELTEVLAASERVALVVYQDVAVLKEAEALKDQFVSMAAHELRTPVTVIAGYTEMMLRRAARQQGNPLDEWQISKLHEMKQATQRLTKLTEDLLDVTRVQGGQLQLRPGPTDLVALTRKLTDQLQATTDRHRLSLQTALPQLWTMVDTFRLEQVLTNLLTNAIKYSPQGGPIEITLEEETHLHEACFRVRDRGIGIPREQQAHIFERFVRAENARAACIGGTGLGLYLCRELIERQGGHIHFESEENSGTTFFFSLPIVAESK